MRRYSRQLTMTAVLLVAVAGGATWLLWPKNSGGNESGKGGGDRGGPAGQGGVKGTPSPLQTNVDAEKVCKEGLDLVRQDKLIAARGKLSEAFFSGKLSDKQQSKIIPVMTELAEKTLLSGACYDHDPYVLRLTVAKGQTLEGLTKKWQLRVPWRMIVKINDDVASAKSVRVGQGVTAIQGPFHAIVSNSRFTMDVYLQREKLPKVFVKRFTVGVGGKKDPTPEGTWFVTLGKKQEKTPWFPSASSPITGMIRWNEPGYPLGKKGYWIALTGRDEKIKHVTGIGIHGTNDLTSIGKAQSIGCIRMRDEDIEWTFAMLYEKWSTVTVQP